MLNPEPPSHNLLVLSDLHLGEQVPQEDRASVQQRVSFQDQQFSAFLHYYTQHTHHNKPWRLVIAGDLLDLMHAHVPYEDDRWYVPAWDQEGALLKLRHLIALYPRIFRAMVTFMHAGHQIYIITGNHDAELNLPSVQCLFYEQIRQIALKAHCDSLLSTLHQQLHFCPWYYAEEGILHIEHGHLHDRLCTVESFLQPDLHTSMRSVSHLAVEAQYRCQESFASVGHHEADHWRTYDIFRHILRQPLRLQSLMFRVAFDSIYRLFWLSWQQRTTHLSPQDLDQIASRHGLCAQRLDALQKRHAPPLYARTFDLVQLLYLDRLLLVSLTAWLVAICLRSARSPHATAAFLTMISCSFVWTYLRLARRFPATTAAPGLITAALHITEQLRVPLTIFGHNHLFERQPLSNKHLYINLGTWSAALAHPSEEINHISHNNRPTITPLPQHTTTPTTPNPKTPPSASKAPKAPTHRPAALPQIQPFVIIAHTDHTTYVHLANWTLQATPHLLASELLSSTPSLVTEAEETNLSALHHAP
ncbi:metallophosphoesterase [Myxococcota bacterium]|nr:metallophosphoesterase [Myxococcota bacterium]